ncbi:conserved hypothetical protein [Hahella chejuensis KCTC 2396]|uniref:DUF3885 domain-containing protein n=1 Tax=Hahella chejuensis (strain KCTC 2396) TaxID=349521 RepID=Q2SMD9_HAHCH|nr:DUF3885 domain-containing protein [Hahella chejuensis]ABC28185.1 conserved hypothetical protein [Hahella chejuensis KCTC 2396]
MTDYLKNAFRGLELSPPLFYKWPTGIRFEIGSPEMGAWINREKRVLNNHYFEKALHRALSICNAAFSATDEVDVVYETLRHRRHKIKIKSHIIRQVSSSGHRNVIFESRKAGSLKGLHWKTAYVTGATSSEINYAAIFLSIVNADFSRRKPSLRGRCYLVNRTRGMVLHLYDDRGLDLIATEKSALREIYTRYNAWILAYDKARIDAMFSDE